MHTDRPAYSHEYIEKGERSRGREEGNRRKIQSTRLHGRIETDAEPREY